MFGPASINSSDQHRQVEESNNQDLSKNEIKGKELNEQIKQDSAKYQVTSSKTRQKCLEKSREERVKIEEANKGKNSPIKTSPTLTRGRRRKRKRRKTTRRQKVKLEREKRSERKRLTCTACCSLITSPSSTSSLSSHSSDSSSSKSVKSALRSEIKFETRSKSKSKSESKSKSKSKSDPDLASLFIVTNSVSFSSAASLRSVFSPVNLSCRPNDNNTLSKVESYHSNLVNVCKRGAKRRHQHLTTSSSLANKRKHEQHRAKRSQVLNNSCLNCDANLVTSSLSSNLSNTCSQCSLNCSQIEPAKTEAESESATTSCSATSSHSLLLSFSQNSSPSYRDSSLLSSWSFSDSYSHLNSNSDSSFGSNSNSTLNTNTNSNSNTNSLCSQAATKETRGALFSCSSSNNSVDAVVDSFVDKCGCSLKIKKTATQPQEGQTNSRRLSVDLQRQLKSDCHSGSGVASSCCRRFGCWRCRSRLGGRCICRCSVEQSARVDRAQHLQIQLAPPLLQHLESGHEESVRRREAIDTITAMDLLREREGKHEKETTPLLFVGSCKALKTSRRSVSLDRLNNGMKVIRIKRDQFKAYKSAVSGEFGKTRKFDSGQVFQARERAEKWQLRTNSWPLLADILSASDKAINFGDTVGMRTKMEKNNNDTAEVNKNRNTSEIEHPYYCCYCCCNDKNATNNNGDRRRRKGRGRQKRPLRSKVSRYHSGSQQQQQQQQQQHDFEQGIPTRKKSLSTQDLSTKELERCKDGSVESIQLLSQRTKLNRSSLIVSAEELLGELKTNSCCSTKVRRQVVEVGGNVLDVTSKLKGNSNHATCLMDQDYCRSISVLRVVNKSNDNNDPASDSCLRASPLNYRKQKLHSSFETRIGIQLDSRQSQHYQGKQREELQEQQQQQQMSTTVQVRPSACSGNQDQQRDQYKLSERESKMETIGTPKDKKIEEIPFEHKQHALSAADDAAFSPSSSLSSSYLRAIKTAAHDIKRSNVLPLQPNQPSSLNLPDFSPKAALVCQSCEIRSQFQPQTQSQFRYQTQASDKPSTSLTSRGLFQPFKSSNIKPSNEPECETYEGKHVASDIVYDEQNLVRFQQQHVNRTKPATTTTSQHLQHNTQLSQREKPIYAETHLDNYSALATKSIALKESPSCVKVEHLEKKYQLCDTQRQEHKQEHLRDRLRESKDHYSRGLPAHIPAEDALGDMSSTLGVANESDAATNATLDFAPPNSSSSPMYRNQLHSFYLYEFFLANPDRQRDEQQRRACRIGREAQQQGIRSKRAATQQGVAMRKANSLEELSMLTSKGDLQDRSNESGPESANEDNGDNLSHFGYDYNYNRSDYIYNDGENYDDDDDDEGIENNEHKLDKLAENLADFAQRSGCVHCHCRHQLLILVRNEQILNRLTLKIKQGSNEPANTRQNQPSSIGSAFDDNDSGVRKSNEIFLTKEDETGAPAENELAKQKARSDIGENNLAIEGEEQMIDPLSLDQTQTQTSCIPKMSPKVQPQQCISCGGVRKGGGSKRRRKAGRKNPPLKLGGSFETCSSILETEQADSSFRSLKLNESMIGSSIMKNLSATKKSDREFKSNYKLDQMGVKSHFANHQVSESVPGLADRVDFGELERAKNKQKSVEIGAGNSRAKDCGDEEDGDNVDDDGGDSDDSGEEEEVDEEDEETISSSSLGSPSGLNGEDEEVDDDLINSKQELSEGVEEDVESVSDTSDEFVEEVAGAVIDDTNEEEDEEKESDIEIEAVEGELDGEDDVALDRGSATTQTDTDIAAEENDEQTALSSLSTPPPSEQVCYSQRRKQQQQKQQRLKTKIEPLAESNIQDATAKLVNHSPETLERLVANSHICTTSQQVVSSSFSESKTISAHSGPQRLNSAPTMAQNEPPSKVVRECSTLSSSGQMSDQKGFSPQQALKSVTGSCSVVLVPKNHAASGSHPKVARIVSHSVARKSNTSLAQQEESSPLLSSATATMTAPTATSQSLPQRQRRLAVSGASAGSNKRSAEFGCAGLDLEDEYDFENGLECSTGTTSTNASALLFGKRQASSTLSFDSQQQQYRTEALNFYRQHFNNPNLVHRRHHRHHHNRQQTGTISGVGDVEGEETIICSRKALSSSTAAQEVFERSSLRSFSTNSSSGSAYFGPSRTGSANANSSLAIPAGRVAMGTSSGNSLINEEGPFHRSQQIEFQLKQQQQQHPLLLSSSSNNQQDSTTLNAQRKRPLNSRDASILISFGLDLECSSLDKQDFLR